MQTQTQSISSGPPSSLLALLMLSSSCPLDQLCANHTQSYSAGIIRSRSTSANPECLQCPFSRNGRNLPTKQLLIGEGSLRNQKQCKHFVYFDNERVAISPCEFHSQIDLKFRVVQSLTNYQKTSPSFGFGKNLEIIDDQFWENFQQTEVCSRFAVP